MPGNDDAALMLADRVLGRRAEYGRRVERVHTASLLLAERLAAGGDVERALLGHLGGGEGKGDCDGEGGRAAMAAFLDGQRGRLRALAERNGGRMREVDAFVAGVAKIRDGMLSRQQGQQQTQLHGQAAPSPEEEKEDEEEKEKGGGARRWITWPPSRGRCRPTAPPPATPPRTTWFERCARGWGRRCPRRRGTRQVQATTTVKTTTTTTLRRCRTIRGDRTRWPS